MTAMVGWGATTNFMEDWTWDQAAETYALDPAMADKLRKNNPQACPNDLVLDSFPPQAPSLMQPDRHPCLDTFSVSLHLHSHASR